MAFTNKSLSNGSKYKSISNGSQYKSPISNGS